MSTDNRRYIWLSWRLIEWKLMYYYPEKVAEEFHEMLSISDDIYDQYELEYLKLCRKLNLPNTVVHKSYAGFKVMGDGMFEVDTTRPCVQLVLGKYGEKKK